MNNYNTLNHFKMNHTKPVDTTSTKTESQHTMSPEDKLKNLIDPVIKSLQEIVKRSLTQRYKTDTDEQIQEIISNGLTQTNSYNTNIDISYNNFIDNDYYTITMKIPKENIERQLTIDKLEKQLEELKKEGRK